MLIHDDGGVTLSADEWKALQVVSRTMAKVLPLFEEIVAILDVAEAEAPASTTDLFNQELVN